MKSGCERIKMCGNRMRWLFMLMAAFMMMLGMSLPVAAGQKWREGDYEFENTTYGVRITAYSGDEKNVTIPGVTHFNNTTYQVAIICDEIFKGNKTIETLSISDNIRIIGNRTFQDCPNLKSVKMANSVTYIGYWAFYNCPELRELNLSTKLQELYGGAFSKTGLRKVTIPASLTTVDDTGNYGPFSNCDYLTSAVIAEGAKTIPYCLFLNCYSLQSVSIPSSMKSINNYAFKGCSNLPEVVIPGNVTHIGDHAFENCMCLKKVVMGNGVTHIGYWAFYNCPELSELNLSTNLKELYGAAFSKTGLTEVTIPASLTTVDDTGNYGPFSYCDYLTSAVIAEGAKTVPSYLFMNCTSLKKVTIASTVKSVDRYAFHNCSDLNSVHFEGTQDAWNTVNIGDYNASLTGAKITFGNKTPASSSTQNTTGNTNGTSNNKNSNKNNNKNNKTTNTSAAALGRVQLKTVKAGKKKATLYWNATPGADGYIIYRSTKKKGGYKRVKTIANGSKTKWTNKKLSRGRKYYFKVKAYKMVNGNMILSDSFSAVKSVKVK